jgi:hypothetical protein
MMHRNIYPGKAKRCARKRRPAARGGIRGQDGTECPGCLLSPSDTLPLVSNLTEASLVATLVIQFSGNARPKWFNAASNDYCFP